MSQEDVFATTLLQLAPSDLSFREIAFAVLCMAAGGKYVTVVSKGHIGNNSAFGFIVGKERTLNESKEFFRVAGSGASQNGDLPGSAPQDNIYWFEQILVVLTSQLYRENAVEQSVKSIAQYCGEVYPSTIVDAVLISIEHVVLVRIVPATPIQHSRLLPLIEIKEHQTMRSTDRYTRSYLSHFADPEDEKVKKRQRRKSRKAMQENMLKNEGINF